MAKAGALPKALTKVDHKSGTPINVLWTQTGLNIFLGLVLPLIIGVANVYNLTGTWFTLALAPVYIVANIGLPIFYRKEHPTEFSVLKHVIIPSIGSLALIIVVYYSVNPLPAWPIGLAPFIVLGWLAIGIIVLFTAFSGSKAKMLERAGDAMM